MENNHYFKLDYKINCLSQLVDIISELLKEWEITNLRNIWFRGQEIFDWDLIPSLYRYNNGSHFERELNREFDLKSDMFAIRQVSSKLEKLVLMQHYGLPTRLLDWTESYLVALFFAIRNNSNKSDGALWVIRPSFLNIVSINEKSIPIESDQRLQQYVLGDPNLRERNVIGELPVAFRPKWLNTRIIAQRGVFTIHGNKKVSLNKLFEEYYNSGKNIQVAKIKIPGKIKENLIQELKYAGVTDLTLFPEIDGVCSDIKRRFLF